MPSSVGSWWKRTSGIKKTVVIFATLLILQTGLCFSTGYWMPVYEQVAGASHDSESGLGLLFFQALLCGITCFIFVVALIVVAICRKPSQNDSNVTDSNKEKQ